MRKKCVLSQAERNGRLLLSRYGFSIGDDFHRFAQKAGLLVMQEYGDYQLNPSDEARSDPSWSPASLPEGFFASGGIVTCRAPSCHPSNSHVCLHPASGSLIFLIKRILRNAPSNYVVVQWRSTCCLPSVCSTSCCRGLQQWGAGIGIFILGGFFLQLYWRSSRKGSTQVIHVHKHDHKHAFPVRRHPDLYGCSFTEACRWSSISPMPTPQRSLLAGIILHHILSALGPDQHAARLPHP